MAHGTADWWSRTRALMDLDFKDLTDTPGSYAGKAGTVPEVTVLEDGLEFSDTVIDAHAARHENGGADEIDVTDLSGILNEEQKSSWALVSGKPATFPPSGHHGSHENGGADEIIIANITASAPYVVTAQGDIVYASAANVLARLAKGASSHMSLFMNAAGTIPEWAAGVKMVGYTYDMSTPSGNQTLDGAGFTPSVAILLFGISDVSIGMGMADGTNNYVIHYDAIYDNDPQFDTNNCIHSYIGLADRAYASMTFNADGGVLAWTKVVNPVGTMTFAVVWLR